MKNVSLRWASAGPDSNDNGVGYIVINAADRSQLRRRFKVYQGSRQTDAHGVHRRAATAQAVGTRRLKRGLDVAGAAGLIVVLAPLLLVIAAIVKLDGGQILFGHKRVGRAGTQFRCWKFRSMVTDADRRLAELLARDPQARAEWDCDFKLRNDPRVTAIGKLLRKTSLDELPQLFNVLRGEMSLVGPRPIVEAEIVRYGNDWSSYCACRPGITGLWQVSGRNDVDYASRVAFDRRYADEWTMKQDLSILLKTVVVVVRRSGAY
jgi:Undecaprenyl-phosphate galactose phosphotransferase WbaP